MADVILTAYGAERPIAIVLVEKGDDRVRAFEFRLLTSKGETDPAPATPTASDFAKIRRFTLNTDPSEVHNGGRATFDISANSFRCTLTPAARPAVASIEYQTAVFLSDDVEKNVSAKFRLTLDNSIVPQVTVERMDLTVAGQVASAQRPPTFPLNEIEIHWRFDFPTRGDLRLLVNRIASVPAGSSSPPKLNIVRVDPGLLYHLMDGNDAQLDHSVRAPRSSKEDTTDTLPERLLQRFVRTAEVGADSLLPSPFAGEAVHEGPIASIAFPLTPITGPISMTVVQRFEIGSSEKPESFPFDHWMVALHNVPIVPVLNAFNEVARSYRGGLREVKAGSPLSTVPLFLTERLTKQLPDPANDISFVLLFRFRSNALTPIKLFPDTLTTFDIPALWENVRNTSGKPLLLTARIAPSLQMAEIDEHNTLDANVFPLKLLYFGGTEPLQKANDVPAEELVTRIGALDLTIRTRAAVANDFGGPAGEARLDSLYGHLKVGAYANPQPLRDSEIPDRDRLFFQVRQDNVGTILAKRLPFTPGSEDDREEEAFAPDLSRFLSAETARALLIPFLPSVARTLGVDTSLIATGGGDFPAISTVETASSDHIIFLAHSEFANARGTQHLTLTLKVRGGTTEQAQVGLPPLVDLSTEPLYIARIDTPRLVIDAEKTVELGHYSTSNLTGAAWELVDAAQRFRLVLQTQVLGEAAEKGTLENGFDDLSEVTAEGKPVEKIAPADFRFAPTTQLLLQRSVFRQNFTEAPWNLRRLLGDARDRSPDPGAGILDMRFELLYGLLGRLQKPGVRLALMEARLGTIPSDRSDRIVWQERLNSSIPTHDRMLTLYKEARNEYAARRVQYLSRLALWEPAAPENALTASVREAEAEPPTPVFSRNLRYRIRDNASRRYPISTRIVEPDPEEGTTVTENGTTFKHLPDGLPGGATWGFESDAVYRELLGAPESEEGSLLTAPIFSALGGWGGQKAVFNTGKTTINAHTSQGRVDSYSVVRVGRIGQSWNRAKHVIVYERTVARTLQFFENQDRLEAVPVLRKAAEYIEFVENRRLLGDATSTRFCEAVTFGNDKTVRIPVDSTWGEDVLVPGKDGPKPVGWKVPLWRNYSPNLTGREDLAPNPIGDFPLLVLLLNEPLASVAEQEALKELLKALKFVDAAGTVSFPHPLNSLCELIREDVRSRLSVAARQEFDSFLVALYQPQLKTGTWTEIREKIAEAVNQLLFGSFAEIFRRAQAGGVEFSLETQDQLRQHQNHPRIGEELARLARMILEDAYPGSLPRSLARVYPRPDVVVEMTPATGQNRAPVQSAVSNPDYIYFFTSTIDGDTADTDRWKPVESVDYLDLPILTPPDTPPGDPTNLDRPQPSAPASEGGYGPLTWLLETGSTEVNLTQGRTSVPSVSPETLSAKVLSITLLRSSPVATTLPDEVKTALTKANEFAQSLDSGLNELLRLLPRDANPSASLPEPLMGELKRQAEELLSNDGSPVKESLRDLAGTKFFDTAAHGTACENVTKRVSAVLDAGETRAKKALNDASKELDRQIALFTTARQGEVDVTTESALTFVDRLFDQIQLLFGTISTGLETPDREIQALREKITSVRDQAFQEIARLKARAEELAAPLQEGRLTAELTERWRALRDDARALTTRLLALLDQLATLATRGGPLLNQVGRDLQTEVRKIQKEIRNTFAAVDATLSNLVESLVGAAQDIASSLTTKLKSDLKDVEDAIRPVFTSLLSAFDNSTKGFVKVVEGAQNQLGSWEGQLQAVRAEVRKPIEDLGQDQMILLATLSAMLRTALDQLRLNIGKSIQTVKGELLTAGSALCIAVEELAGDLKQAITDAVNNLTDDIIRDVPLAEIQRALEQARRRAEHETATVLGQLKEQIRAIQGGAEPLFQDGKATLDLARALVEAPQAIGQTLNRDQIALYLLEPGRILTSPAVALGNRLGNDLKALGLRVPFRELTDQFVPDLSGLRLGDLLPDIGGLKLDNLFSGVELPFNASENVRFTKNFDPQTRTAWMRRIRYPDCSHKRCHDFLVGTCHSAPAQRPAWMLMSMFVPPSAPLVVFSRKPVARLQETGRCSCLLRLSLPSGRPGYTSARMAS